MALTRSNEPADLGRLLLSIQPIKSPQPARAVGDPLVLHLERGGRVCLLCLVQVETHQNGDGQTADVGRDEVHELVALVERYVAWVGRLELIAAVVLLRFQFLENSLQQDTSVALALLRGQRADRYADDTFVSNNSTIISKLTEMLNSNLSDNMRSNTLGDNGDNQQIVYSASYASRQLLLASIFCATASHRESSLWHVSKGLMSDMSTCMQTCLYESTEPEKQHVALLMKGDSANERILRINIACRRACRHLLGLG